MELGTFDKAFERVVSATPEKTRQEFGRLCRSVVEAVDNGDITVNEAAYRICGTAARILEDLSRDDRDLMLAAGNLELPDAQRDATQPDWESFKRRVGELFPVE